MRRFAVMGAALLLGAAATLASAPAVAKIVTITGVRDNVNPLAPLGVGRCGPGRSTVSIQPGPGSSTGTSNFGDFTSTQSHCITPPVPAPFDSGLFTYNFADGDTCSGPTPAT